MVAIEVHRSIAAPPERIFDWLTDPVNLTAAPLFLRAGWVRGVSGPGVGARREVVVLGAWLREEITAWDAPRSYSYRVIRSVPPSDHQGGTVTVTPSGEGADVTWATAYTVPALGGGKVVEAVTLPVFRWSFRAILDGCAKALER